MWYRSRVEKQRLKKLYGETKYSYGAGAYYDEHKKRYIRYSCNDKALRQIMNRRVRRKLKRNHEDIVQIGQYKKLAEYWWILL